MIDSIMWLLLLVFALRLFYETIRDGIEQDEILGKREADRRAPPKEGTLPSASEMVIL